MKKIILIVLAAFSCVAQAADGAYAGLTLNNMELKSDNSSSVQAAPGIYAGYQIGSLGLEMSYAKKNGFFSTNATVAIWDLALIPRLNVAKDVDLIGKLGGRHSLGASYTASQEINSLVWGAGIEYGLMPQLSVRAMLDYSDKTGNDKVKATTTTWGRAYKF